MQGLVVLKSLHSLVPEVCNSILMQLLHVVFINMFTAVCRIVVGHVKNVNCSLLLQEGFFINLGSVAAVEPMKSTPVYAASKWGLRGWSLSCYEVIL